MRVPHAPVRGQQPVFMSMGRNEVERVPANIQRSAGGLQRVVHFLPRAFLEEMLEVLFVAEAVIDGWRGGSRRARNGAHRQRLFASLTPQAVSHVDDSAFQSRILSARHAPSRSRERPIIFFTALKIQCINNSSF